MRYKVLWISLCMIVLLGLTGCFIQTRQTLSSEKIIQKTENFSEKALETTNINITDELPQTEAASLSDVTETIAVKEETAVNEEKIVSDTGLLVCIDPGHYKGASKLQGENIYDYEEGIFTLKIALALRDELERYGIHSYLTRENDSINISGYENEKLDHGKISLRGEMAKGADLFVSIHTNANQESANGYPTCNQPKEINKTIVLVNQIAAKSEQIVQMANEIGQAVTRTSYMLGICDTDQFQCADIGDLREWTDSYNDSIQSLGTVCYRLGQHGDYYGVLRGAANVGVPGMIVEHGFHTVEEVRRQAEQGNLDQEWARADAYGIAKGFGIVR